MRNTSSNTDLCEYSEKTGDGNLQPINSHELGLGTHLGPGRRWLAREKHKKRGQNEAHCIVKELNSEKVSSNTLHGKCLRCCVIKSFTVSTVLH